MSEDSWNDETLQLPSLSQVVELPQDFVADTLDQITKNPPHKWDFPDPIQAAKPSAAVSGRSLPGRSKITDLTISAATRQAPRQV